ncbi:MAG: indole-3-glycerol-phosphate synthase [Fimbriimonadaceae bacterium]|nr:indole-3-glycerol-phosphate synthase [Fimbriimonadaceae bacterium]
MILDDIMRRKRSELAARSPQELREAVAMLSDAPPVRGFRSALTAAERRPALIAEIKRRSPSRRAEWPGIVPARFAALYQASGAAALSVLTDGPGFGGSPQDLREARAACSLPVLRKDFTVGELDVYEARAMGADAILLIVRGLDDAELRGLGQLASSLGLAALVEVHDRGELERALASGAEIVGVNNRDLANFQTTLEPSLELLPKIPPGVTRVSESALHSTEDVRSVHESGADCVLIGTAFCSASDPGAKVREVMGW